jgi:lysophospholipid acyltransferase (LPLAT)-like uncharacterized protein
MLRLQKPPGLELGRLKQAGGFEDTNHRGAASSVVPDAIGQMNNRELREIGLSLTRGSTLKNGYASAEAQLGMVR